MDAATITRKPLLYAALFVMLCASATNAALPGYRCLNFEERAECLRVYLELRHEVRAIQYLCASELADGLLIRYRELRAARGYCLCLHITGPAGDEYYQAVDWLERVERDGARPVPRNLDREASSWLTGGLCYFTMADSERQRQFCRRYLAEATTAQYLAAIEREIAIVAAETPNAREVYDAFRTSYQARCLTGVEQQHVSHQLHAIDQGPSLPPYHRRAEPMAHLDLLGQAGRSIVSTAQDLQRDGLTVSPPSICLGK